MKRNVMSAANGSEPPCCSVAAGVTGLHHGVLGWDVITDRCSLASAG
jgi:hypothetical protein